MPEPHSPSLVSVRSGGFDLVSALDSYEAAGTRLVESWFDIHAYAAFGRQIEGIREHAVPVPALTVLALQLFIAHCELVSTMWQNAAVGVSAAAISEAGRRHAVAVAALRMAAARLPASE